MKSYILEMLTIFIPPYQWMFTEISISPNFFFYQCIAGDIVNIVYMLGKASLYQFLRFMNFWAMPSSGKLLRKAYYIQDDQKR